MSALTSPQRRPNPLHGFAPYEGEFNVLDFDYVAVRSAARFVPGRPADANAQATAWTGLFGIVLAACVIVLTLLYLLTKAALWLLNRHAIRIVRDPRRHVPGRPRCSLRRAPAAAAQCGPAARSQSYLLRGRATPGRPD